MISRIKSRLLPLCFEIIIHTQLNLIGSRYNDLDDPEMYFLYYQAGSIKKNPCISNNRKAKQAQW